MLWEQSYADACAAAFSKNICSISFFFASLLINSDGLRQIDVTSVLNLGSAR